jgi:hypothetical protein
MWTLALLTMLVPPSNAAPTSGKILASWVELLSTGCDVSKSHVNTAFEARILRNVPFAQQGYVFKTLQLARMFEGDGGWYAPVAGKSVSLSTTEQSCVEALKARETALRAAQPIADSTYDWLLWQTDLYLTLRSYTRTLRFESGPKNVEVGSGCSGDGKGGFRYVWLDASCPSAHSECSGVLFECNADCQCSSGIGG